MLSNFPRDHRCGLTPQTVQSTFFLFLDATLLMLHNSSSTLPITQQTLSLRILHPLTPTPPKHYPDDTRRCLLMHASKACSCSPAKLPSPHAHQPTGRSQEPTPHPAGEPGCRAGPVPLTKVPRFTAPMQTPLLVPCGRPQADSRVGPGPRDAGLAARLPSRFPSSPPAHPAPPRPHTTNNLCFKDTCRHGCASRVENVGVEIVRFLLLRPGTRLDRGRVGTGSETLKREKVAPLEQRGWGAQNGVSPTLSVAWVAETQRERSRRPQHWWRGRWRMRMRV